MRVRDMRTGPERMLERGAQVEHELLRSGPKLRQPKPARGALVWTSVRYDAKGVLQRVQGTLCYQPKDKRARRERRARSREWAKLEREAARGEARPQ